MITLEKRFSTQRCRACGVEVRTVRGAILDGGQPFGRFFLALHRHSREDRVAQLALALLDRRRPEVIPVSVALDVSGTARGFELTVVDWDELPWAEETSVGTLLDKAEVVDNPLRPLVLQLADEVLRGLPEVQPYFAVGPSDE